MHTHDRIAIIGAGAAGLSAAEALRERGYTHIQLLERSERAGGKCCSMEYDNRSYELGAGILAETNTVALRIARKYKVPMQQATFGKSIVVDAQTGALLRKSFTHTPRVLYQSFFRYKRLCEDYARITTPGFTHVPPELCVPFVEFAHKHRIEDLAYEFSLFFTGFGYDYFERIPAAYVLKYYSWATLMSFVKKQIYTFPEGIQHVWSTVARTHDVRYHTQIKQIEHHAKGVRITTQQSTQEYDHLIVTSPLDEYVQFTDATEEERALFSQIRSVDYRTYACVVRNIPALSGYVPGNFTPTRAGHPVFWYQRYQDSNLYMFYILGDWKLSDQDAEQYIARVTKTLGGSIENIERKEHWKYFPHVTSETMRAGFFDTLEQLQGKRHTFYAGELLNFSTVGLTAEYADALVKRFF